MGPEKNFYRLCEETEGRHGNPGSKLGFLAAYLQPWLQVSNNVLKFLNPTKILFDPRIQ
jgi:hypothetical protein